MKILKAHRDAAKLIGDQRDGKCIAVATARTQSAQARFDDAALDLAIAGLAEYSSDSQEKGFRGWRLTDAGLAEFFPIPCNTDDGDDQCPRRNCWKATRTACS